MNIRQKINRSKMSKAERVLRENGITQASEYGPEGVLTETGRRVVLDVLWTDEELRQSVINAVDAVSKQEREDNGEEGLLAAIRKAVGKK